jgi:hypothetical protein
MNSEYWYNDGWNNDGYPTPPPKPAPSPHTASNSRVPCTDPKRNIPEKCEVDVLIKMLDIEFNKNHKLIGQSLR